MNTTATEIKFTTENNAIIAEFMGYKKELFYQLKQGDNWEQKDYGFYDLPFNGGVSLAGIEKTWFPQTELKFHSDWNWLMPVVAKIQELSGGGLSMSWHIEKQYETILFYIAYIHNKK